MVAVSTLGRVRVRFYRVLHLYTILVAGTSGGIIVFFRGVVDIEFLPGKGQ